MLQDAKKLLDEKWAKWADENAGEEFVDPEDAVQSFCDAALDELVGGTAEDDGDGDGG